MFSPVWRVQVEPAFLWGLVKVIFVMASSCANRHGDTHPVVGEAWGAYCPEVVKAFVLVLAQWLVVFVRAYPRFPMRLSLLFRWGRVVCRACGSGGPNPGSMNNGR